MEWLNGERFLIMRSENDHPDFPDSISMIGDTDGPQSHYFDSRGVHRVYELRATDDGWELVRDSPELSQRLSVTFADGDTTMVAVGRMSRDGAAWEDDIRITYRLAG